MPKTKGVLLGIETAKRVLKLAGQRTTEKIPEPVKRKQSSSDIRFFVLLEDFDGNGPCKAKWVARLDNTSRGVDDVYAWDNLLDGAPAGWKGVFAKIDNEWVPPVAPCFTVCEHEGTLTIGSPPDGVVGTSYSHSITVANLDAGSISAPDLPPGLSIDGTTGAITGTPTEAGEFGFQITATSPKTGGGGDCTLTRYVTITITES